MRRFAIAVALLAGCGRPPDPPPVSVSPETAPPPAQPSGSARIEPPAPSLPPALANATRPTCALIDPDKNPRVAVLEAQLLTDPSTVWVERSGIDAVVKEQKLQALFSPEGVGDRVRLGKLLKADLLVLVRPATEVKEPALEVVVGETTGGLRLALRAVPVTADVATDTAGLAAAVRDGVARGRQPITAVVAVPPFVSHDLGHEHAHRKAAYARLVESVALARSGVVGVELAEAEALGKELALSGTAALVRPLPVYLFGEFRHDGPPASRTATLDLRAEHAGRPVGAPARVTVPADQVPAAVRAWADGALDAAAAGARRPPAPRAEAQLLADRADTFERLGNWAEAAALRETALLLDPTRFDVRVGVFNPLARQLDALTTRARESLAPRRPVDPDVTRDAHAIQRRGLDYLELLLTREDLFRTYLSGAARGAEATFLQAVGKFAAAARAADAPGAAEMRAECGAAVMRLVPRLAEHNRPNQQGYVWTAVAGLPPAEKCAWVEQLVLRTAALPGAQARTVLYVGSAHIPKGPGVSGDANGVYAGMLARLDAADNPEVRAAVADIRRQDAAALSDLQRFAAKPPERVEFALKPLALVHDADGRPAGPLTGLLAAGPGADLVWTPAGVYLMKTKGRLRPVWTGPAAVVEGGGYDGRYAWAVVYPPGESPRLLVVDPASEKSWTTPPTDGLPEGDPQRPKGRDAHPIRVAPVGPGRACVAGSFGQTWVGVATLDAAAGRVAVKVIHEAREAQAPNSPGQLDTTTVDFVPGFAHALTGRAGSRVLFGRGPPLSNNLVGRPNPDLVDRPLVVNPDKGTVEVLRNFSPRRAEHSYQWVAVADGTAYGARSAGAGSTWEVVRMGADDLKWTPIGPARATPLPAGAGATVIAAAVHGGRLYYVLRAYGPNATIPSVFINWNEYWSAALDGSGAREFIPTRPWVLIHGLYTSSHYGPLLAAQVGPAVSLYLVPDPAVTGKP